MKFYVLSSPRDTDGAAVTDFSKSGSVNRGEAPTCPICGGFTGMLPWLPPYRAELEVWGKDFGDIAFGPGNELLVAQRVADAFKSEGLVGFSGFDEVDIVKVIRRGGSKITSHPPRYYCVAIARSRAAIDVEASGLVHEEPFTCPECRIGLVKRTTRIVLEEGTWSGEDVFYARGLPGTILASERFKAFFDRYSVDNGTLIDAAGYSFDFYPWEKNAGSLEP